MGTLSACCHAVVKYSSDRLKVKICFRTGGFIPSMQRYYRSFFFIIYYYLNCYMFRSYVHLQAEIYLLEFTGLITDPLFLEYSYGLL
jgi:hypothetical protein